MKNGNNEPGVDFHELDRRAKEGGDTGTMYEEFTPFSEGGVKGRAGDKAARVLREPLERYRRKDIITPDQYDDARWLQRKWEFATASGSLVRFDGSVPPDRYGPRSVPDAQITASVEVSRVLVKLGVLRASLVRFVVFQGYSVAAYAVANKMGQTRTWGLFRAALDKIGNIRR